MSNDSHPIAYTGGHLDRAEALLNESKDMKRELGAVDRVRVDRYLENIREIERRIERVEVRNTGGELRELPDAPAGVPDSFSEHMRLMFDLQVLAFESDVKASFSAE